ncbi:hypothetical protein Krac_1256 [Ktedonobacter racemifer DSM 44963]|uniref:Uncharacterized protein n=1 Tax=Ktedonobacter racemifer DSM 44963 TaxID=485913 RepID=D6U6N0_KTERA|nr:hypothetical protein Krac_1256 [Ktedonobacter racemifer DSM 44963]
MRKVVRPQALGMGILSIIMGLIFLAVWPGWTDLLFIGGGIALVLVSGYIIKMPY